MQHGMGTKDDRRTRPTWNCQEKLYDLARRELEMKVDASQEAPSHRAVTARILAEQVLNCRGERV